MRISLVAALTALPLALATPRLGAQSTSGDGIIPGDYLRVSGGAAAPLNAQGSLRDWNAGPTVSVVWENWQPGSTGGAGNISFGFAGDYSRLGFNQEKFLAAFQPIQGGRATSAQSSGANVFGLDLNARFRLPNPVIVPSFILGFGFLHYRPSPITYSGGGVSGTTQQAHRTGGSFSLGAGVDRLVYDRTALFGEAIYTYGLTSLGYATPQGICVTADCDINKNTALGVVRGGLRVRIGR